MAPAPSATVTLDRARYEDVAVVLAAHGSSRRPDANAVVGAHAERMRRDGPFPRVSTAFLLGDTSPAAAGRTIRDAATVLIVPYLMSDGYLAGEIAAQISTSLDDTSRVIVAEPVGTHDGVTAIVRHTGERALIRAGFDATASTLVVAAHGSTSRPESKVAAMAHVDRLRATGAFAHVALAMLEEPPLLDDVLASLDGPAVVVGLFAAPGGHAIDDVQKAVAERGHPQLVDAGPIGTDPRMAEIALLRAHEALAL